MHLPLHAAMYQQYEGHVLPPAAATERQMEALGVRSKQTERARQTLSKSAAYVGFIESGSGWLVRPPRIRCRLIPLTSIGRPSRPAAAMVGMMGSIWMGS
jgi:hypothetical protein